ncbi:TldD/PmbA family protein [bacterium]|nr:TldD/PmbA family protein [bacterium]
MTWKQKIENSTCPSELFFNSYETRTVKFKERQLNEIETKENDALVCRLIKDGRIGMSSGSGQVPFDRLYSSSLQNAVYGKEAQFSFVAGPGNPEEWTNIDPALEQISTDELIDRGQNVTDRLTHDLPDYSSNVGLSIGDEKSRIINNAGLDRSYRQNSAGLSYSLDKTSEGDMIMFASYFHHLPTNDELEEAIEHDVELVKLCENVVSLAPGKYPVLFHPVSMTFLWEPLYTALNGNNIYQQMSPLKDRIGELIFSEQLTIWDDPSWLEGMNRCHFDDEGVMVNKNVLVERGVLRSHLHNLDTAAKLGLQSTGHGFRKNWLTNQRELEVSPRIMPTNRLITPGHTPVAELMRGIDTGLLLWFTFDCWIGNLINGDFSGTIDLGFKVQKGKPVGRIKNMRISGNIYTLFGQQLVSLSDTRLNSLTGYDLFPHILCKDVSLA